MKKLLVIVVCVSMLIVAIGSTPPTYERVKDAFAGVEIASNQVLLDISSISFSFLVISDFVKGADYFETEWFMATDNNGFLTGEAGFTYKAFEVNNLSPTGDRVMSEETFVLFKEGTELLGAYDVITAYLETIAPVSDLLTYDASEEAEWGFFEKVFNTIKWTLISIWSAGSAIVHTAVDTINVAWQIIRGGLVILGLMSPTIEGMNRPSDIIGQG